MRYVVAFLGLFLIALALVWLLKPAWLKALVDLLGPKFAISGLVSLGLAALVVSAVDLASREGVDRGDAGGVSQGALSQGTGVERGERRKTFITPGGVIQEAESPVVAGSGYADNFGLNDDPRGKRKPYQHFTEDEVNYICGGFGNLAYDALIAGGDKDEVPFAQITARFQRYLNDVRAQPFMNGKSGDAVARMVDILTANVENQYYALPHQRATQLGWRDKVGESRLITVMRRACIIQVANI